MRGPRRQIGNGRNNFRGVRNRNRVRHDMKRNNRFRRNNNRNYNNGRRRNNNFSNNRKNIVPESEKFRFNLPDIKEKPFARNILIAISSNF